MDITAGQLSIFLAIVIQTVTFAYFFGGFKGRTETRLDEHGRRIGALEEAQPSGPDARYRL